MRERGRSRTAFFLADASGYYDSGRFSLEDSQLIAGVVGHAVGRPRRVHDDLDVDLLDVVHLFDELARTVPDGVHLVSVRQQGNRLTIQGKAQSSTRVSAYMRNIDKSEWLKDPGLDVVETKDTGPSRSSEFTIFASQATRTNEEGEEE